MQAQETHTAAARELRANHLGQMSGGGHVRGAVLVRARSRPSARGSAHFWQQEFAWQVSTFRRSGPNCAAGAALQVQQHVLVRCACHEIYTCEGATLAMKPAPDLSNVLQNCALDLVKFCASRDIYI